MSLQSDKFITISAPFLPPVYSVKSPTAVLYSEHSIMSVLAFHSVEFFQCPASQAGVIRGVEMVHAPAYTPFRTCPIRIQKGALRLDRGRYRCHLSNEVSHYRSLSQVRSPKHVCAVPGVNPACLAGSHRHYLPPHRSSSPTSPREYDRRTGKISMLTLDNDIQHHYCPNWILAPRMT